MEQDAWRPEELLKGGEQLGSKCTRKKWKQDGLIRLVDIEGRAMEAARPHITNPKMDSPVT